MSANLKLGQCAKAGTATRLREKRGPFSEDWTNLEKWKGAN